MKTLQASTPPMDARDLLGGLIGQRLVAVHRIERFPFEGIAPQLGMHDPTQYFSKSGGDVFMQFNS